MADKEQLELLKESVNIWNSWRKDNPFISPDLSEADFSGANLRQANLSRADLNNANLREVDLQEADLSGAHLIGADLSGAHLSEADFSGAHLIEANLSGANLRQANLIGADLKWANLRKAHLNWTKLRKAYLNEADLSGAHLIGADLSRADLSGTDLIGTDLSGAYLSRADLSGAILIETNLSNVILSDCNIYGISVWNLKIEGAIQKNLVISRKDEPIITVDNLEVAQFIYLLLHNEKIRDVIDTITTKTVLILGRFTDERKTILDSMREELRNRNYIPILFDFDKPTNRDLTETVMTLFSLARFVIADLSDPHSIPHELMSLAEKMPSVPIQPLFHPTPEHLHPYPMFEHLLRYPHVLSIYHYDNQETLMAALTEKVIDPAEAKAKEMMPKKLW